MTDKSFLNGPVAAVILPTYCEAENIESLIREIQELKLNLMIAVIDDSSPDGTAKMVKKLQREYHNVLLVVRPEKLGLGTAIITAFQSILSLENQQASYGLCKKVFGGDSISIDVIKQL